VSIVRCEECNIQIDTDFDVECIREELDDKVLCDKCWSETTNEEGELE